MRAIAPSLRSASVYGGRRPSLPRELRRRQTEAEAQLWHHLRNRSLCGAKFRRQQPLGRYVLDFYCAEHALAVEVDGGQHFETEATAQDSDRTSWLEAQGIRVLRFTNAEVMNETTAVLEQITIALEGSEGTPSP